MHLTGMSIDRVPPFTKPVKLKFDERVNLFIGPNASGKSTILRTMKELHSLPDDYPGVFHSPSIAVSDGAIAGYRKIIQFENYKLETATFSMDTTADWPLDFGSVPFLHVPAIRVTLPERSVFGLPDDERKDISTNQPPSIFYSQAVTEEIESARTGLESRVAQNQFRKALDIGYSCAKSICREIIRDDRHHWTRIGTIDEVLEDPLPANVLSSGTQGTLMWIWWLALNIVENGDFDEGWEKKPAILLIDEIENHLHPTWQRRVIRALLDHFPGLQIFATTHSPFVVAGRKAGQVHLLKRENGVVTATTHPEDIIGWTADEILRTMMGVEEPTDQLTVDRANRLRQLREKETLTPEEEDELSELRRQVNEDLLSKGGPLETQRARYADLMQRFLLSRQSDLTQDGG